MNKSITAEAIAEITSASHDNAEHGERGIRILRDFQHLEYGTKLYALPAQCLHQLQEPSTEVQEATAAVAAPDELAAALDRMDALLEPGLGMLAVGDESATAQASRRDMAAIRAALAARYQPLPDVYCANPVAVNEIKPKGSATGGTWEKSLINGGIVGWKFAPHSEDEPSATQASQGGGNA